MNRGTQEMSINNVGDNLQHSYCLYSSSMFQLNTYLPIINFLARMHKTLYVWNMEIITNEVLTTISCLANNTTSGVSRTHCKLCKC